METLTQVLVEDTQTGRQIPVGPKMNRKASEGLCQAINIEILKGRERAWAHPTIVSAVPQ